LLVPAKKLLVKPGHTVRVVNAPDGYGDLLPQTAETGPTDAVLLFVNDRAELDAHLPSAIEAVKPGGLLWVAYKKGGAKAGTDLNRDILWQAVEPRGWTGVSLVAVDDRWSAMRFRPADKVGT
jgi:hypothetical protein